jgi:hypothetical protein
MRLVKKLPTQLQSRLLTGSKCRFKPGKASRGLERSRRATTSGVEVEGPHVAEAAAGGAEAAGGVS